MKNIKLEKSLNLIKNYQKKNFYQLLKKPSNIYFIFFETIFYQQKNLQLIQLYQLIKETLDVKSCLYNSLK